jgi:manganese-dependent inorganic pyrophosphatase
MSESELLVIGHRNPDTDAICSAIGYAEFKRRTGFPHAVAARCGDTNERIDFVLRTFGVAAPKFVADVAPKIRDVMQDNVVSVTSETTVVEALTVMDAKGIRVLPILSAKGICEGLVSVFKMSKFFCPTTDRVFDSRRVLASVSNIVRTLDAKVVLSFHPELEEDLILMVGAMTAESFAKRLPMYPPEKLVVIVGDRWEIQREAIRGHVRMVIVTGGLPLEESIIEEAKKNGVNLLISPHDTATTAMLVRSAISVKHMMHEHFLTFRADEALQDVQGLAAASNFQAFPVLDEKGKTIGILSKSDFLKKVDRQIILVDHNELSQAVQGAAQAEIIEIIDHHRIGTFTTSQPILFRNEPVGSTSTIVADSFFRSRVEMPREIAGLLLAGLVSDTLNLTSPTTTERDAEVLKKLEEIAGVDADQFTEKLFASGSVLISLPAAKAVVADCKEFQEQGKSFSVAQIEELGFDQFWKRKNEVISALEDHRRSKNYYFSALLVTDVVRNTSLLLVTGAQGFLKQIDYPSVEQGIFELEGVVSRKKQLLPYLTHCLQKGGARVVITEALPAA